jgi:tetratricopeptide (TPR) repeat protein
MDLEPNELLALAREQFEQQQLEKSLVKIKTLLAEHHPPAGTLELAARVYARLRLYDRALALLREALEQDPSSLERRIELAMLQQDSGDREGALVQWEDLLQQHPLMPPALFNAAWLRAQRAQLADAHRHLDVLLETVPKDNLYAERGRELKRLLQEQASASSTADATM